MRRLLIVVLFAALSTAPHAQSGASSSRPQQTDGIVQLLNDLEAAIVSGQARDFDALAAASLPADARGIFTSAAAGGATTAAVRERIRKPLESGRQIEILAEVFASHGRAGRLSTWLVTVQPRADAADRYEIAGLTESAAFGGLLHLTLTQTKQFAVHNLTVQAPDLTLRMVSGSAFVGESDLGVTALVLRGAGTLTFTPKNPAEQGQLVAFAKKPVFEDAVDTVFVRLDPSEFGARVAERALTPVAVDPRELARAQVIFDEFVKKTFSVDLRDLSSVSWSFQPAPGGVVVESRTAHYNWLTYARSPNEAEDVAFHERGRGRNICLYASAERLRAHGASYNEDDLVPYDIERYALDVSFDPKASWVKGRATLSLRLHSAGAAVISLRLAGSLAVSSATSPRFGRLLTMRVLGQNSLFVNLPGAVAPDTPLVLEIAYAGPLSPQPIDTDAPAAQKSMSIADQPGTGQAAETTIAPEPRFLYSNQVSWYPQSLVSDYATATTRFRVPPEYQIIANGRLVRSSVAPASGGTGVGASTEEGSTRTVEYIVERPVRYLSCLITRLVEVGQTKAVVPAIAPVPDTGTPAGTTVAVDVLSTPRIAGANRPLPARVVDIVRVFANLIGEAPYPDLTVAGVDDNLPGGHAPAGMVIWLEPMPTTPFTWAGDPLSMDFKYAPFFLAHEVAHQWWGQAVGWKNYHEQWLSEGLAQYFATLYAGADRGPDLQRDLLIQMRLSAAAYTDRGPISLGYRLGRVQGDSRIFRAIVYNKSTIVLHMLRRLIGDEAFFAGLRRYYHDHRFDKAGTDDLREAFEAGTPMKLERFFDRWIRGASVPRLRVTTRTDAQSAVVRIEQVGEVFDLPFTVTLQYNDGRTEAVTIQVTDALTERTIPLKGALRRILTRDDLTLAGYVK